jgi:hypothetical protein
MNAIFLPSLDSFIQCMSFGACLQLDMPLMGSGDEPVNVENLMISQEWPIRCLTLRLYNKEICTFILKKCPNIQSFRLELPDNPRVTEYDGQNMTFLEIDPLTQCSLDQLSISQPTLRRLELYCSHFLYVKKAFETFPLLEWFIIGGSCGTQMVRNSFFFVYCMHLLTN